MMNGSVLGIDSEDTGYEAWLLLLLLLEEDLASSSRVLIKICSKIMIEYATLLQRAAAGISSLQWVLLSGVICQRPTFQH